MNLTMVGTGYVGLVTGACFADTGNTVICLDVDEGKIARLRAGECPIYEPGLPELLKRNVRAGRLHFTTDKPSAYADAEIVFICVGTPSGEDGSADLKYVLHAANDIADAIERLGPGADPKVVVVKSTVPVGTTHRVQDVIRGRTRFPFGIANNPEFLKEGAAVTDFKKPDRVVCGVEEESVGQVLRDLYEPFVRQGNPILVMDIRSSEMVKYASNAMLATKISFINEIANLCEFHGADVRFVREGMCADHRIGNQFLYPGLGFGGSCFPKDTRAVMGMGHAVGYACRLMQAVNQVNDEQRAHFWKKILDHFGPNLPGRTLAFWGAAFKPETDDIREAPAITLMGWAIESGANVRAYDPIAGRHLSKAVPAAIVAGDMYEAIDGADALIVCTEWSEFRNPDFKQMGARLKQRVIFDGRNIYRRQLLAELGFTYYAVGRPPVLQPEHARGQRPVSKP